MALAALLLWRLIQRDTVVPGLIDWLTPNLAPTLSLVGGVALLTKPEAESPLLRTAFWQALLLSLVYLVTLTAAVMIGLTTAGALAEMITPFNKLLGLFQGAVAASLGVFFAKSSKSG